MFYQQSIEGQQLRDEISQRGYAEFTHGVSSDEIEQLVDAYTDFTLNHPDPEPSTVDAMLGDTPQDLSKSGWLDVLDYSRDKQETWHKYRTNVSQIGKPDGYTSRSFQVSALRRARGLSIADDPKEYYHFTPVHYAAMALQHQEFGWGPVPPEVNRLDRAFAPIHRKAAELITRICSLMEETHPEVHTVITPTSLRTSPVRLLFYHPGQGDQLGEAHYDKSFATLQIAESHEGLRVATGTDSALEPVVRDDEHAVFFPGLVAAERLEENVIYHPGWHDIFKSDRLNQGRTVPARSSEVCARWALIFFANGTDYHDPGKTATHVR